MKSKITPVHTLQTNGNGQPGIEPPHSEPPPQTVLPGGPSGGLPGGPNDAAPLPGRRIRPLASLKAHKLLALIVAMAVFAIGIPVAWMMGQAKYYTEAVVRVSPRFLKNLNEDQELQFQSNSQYREFVQQQVNTVNRYDIVLDGLKKLGEQRHLYQVKGESDRRAAERLAVQLAIRPVPDSYLIAIGLEGSKPDGLAEVINSVVETYLERSKSEEFYASDQRIETIRQEREKLLQELEQKSTQRTALAQEIGVTTFNEGLMNPYDQLLLKSKEALETTRRRRIEVDAQYAALENERQPDGKTAADAIAQEQATKDNGLTALKSNLYIRRSQLLSKISGLAPEHPGRRGIERELAEIDTELERASSALTASFRSMSQDQRRAEVYQARRVEKELTAEVEAQSSRANWFASRYHGAVALGDDIARARKRIAAIDDRVDFLTLEASAPGFVRMVSPARIPETPFKGSKRKLFAFVLFASLVFGLIAPIAVDLVDPRIHASGELQKLLGFAPTGWVLDQRDEATRLFAEDQLIRLATGLDREHREHGTKIVVFTSVTAGEGTSSLVLDLTQALIKLGTRAIAVEANAMMPDARYQDERSHLGLVALLDGKEGIEDVIAPGNELLPERLSVGPAEGRRPLATVAQLRHTLTELTHHYEIVLVDAPPMLLSADAELLIGMSDATLLVIEAGGEPKAQIKRAARLIERIAPPVVGAILNRVRVYSEGNYFAEMVREHYSGMKRLAGNQPPASGKLPAGARLPGKKSRASRLLSPWLWK